MLRKSELSLKRRLALAGATAFVAVLILVLAAYMNLCGLGENRSYLYEHRCESSIPDWPLLGYAVLVLGYVLSRLLARPWIRVLSLVLALVPAVVAWSLLSVP